MKAMYLLLFEVFGLFCHQLPERSLFLGDFQLPLCIRCTAICLGGALALGYLLARLRPLGRGTLLMLASPMLIELSLVILGYIETTNATRGVTGLGFGFASLLGVLYLLAGLGEPEETTVRGRPRRGPAESTSAS